MALYDDIITRIVQYIRTNANYEITGDGLQQKLVDMVRTLGTNSQLMGFIKQARNLGDVPDTKLFWFAVNNTTSPYAIDGTDLVTTMIEPKHVYVVHNADGFWAVEDIASSDDTAGAKLIGLINQFYGEDYDIGNPPDEKVFYIAYSTNSSYNILENGVQATTVSQGQVLIIHNLLDSSNWVYEDILNFLLTTISEVRRLAESAFANMATRGCITLCMPYFIDAVETYVNDAVRADNMATLDIYSAPDDTYVIDDNLTVKIGKGVLSRIYIRSSIAEFSNGPGPYRDRPNCVIFEDAIYYIGKISGFWIKSRVYVFNVPHIIDLSSDAITAIQANTIKVVVHPCLLSTYQSMYSTISSQFISMSRIMGDYINGRV